MLSPRPGTLPGALLAGLCALATGCQSTSTVGAVFSRNGTAVAMQQSSSQSEVRLNPGMEIQWHAQTSQEQPSQIKSGRALVAPDGTVEVGPYGACKVAGMTMSQATSALEKHLAAYLPGASVQMSTIVPNQTAITVAAPMTIVHQTGELTWRAARTSSQNAMTIVTPATTESPAAATTIQPVGWQTGGNTIEQAGPVIVSEPGPAVVEAGFARRTIYRPGIALAPVALAPHGPYAMPGSAPGELSRVNLPTYVVGPPDILAIESLKGLLNQPVRGPHLVRPDGTVGLGSYGSALVAGLTIDQAKGEIARVIHSRLDPKVVSLKDVVDGLSVDVLAYNSKVYYVITDGGGNGEQVIRLPITGNENVLDAISQINGLPPVASKNHIWIARRTPGAGGPDSILPVDWIGITQRGAAETNYQVMPGDRIYVRADRWRTIDSAVAKVLSPFERILGITLLGSQTVNSIRNGTVGTP